MNNAPSMWTVRQKASEVGSHWFERGSMRFFQTKLHGQPFNYQDRIFFITSEAMPAHPPYHNGGPRMFSIREAKADGHIGTLGKFHSYASMREAKRAIPALVANGEVAL